jgi:hypothetical protein
MLITCLVLTVFRSQKDIATDMALALRKLCGWDWGGHGNTVFFVLGAYQEENTDIVTFRCAFLLSIFPRL